MLALGLGLGACDSGVGATLDLRFPDADKLSPAIADISEVSLVYWRPGDPTRRVSAVLENGELADDELLSLPPGEKVRMAVELRNGNQRLVGFGRTAEPVEIRADEPLTVSVEMRRPLVYLGEPEGTAVLDTTVDATSVLAKEHIALGGAVQMAVPSYDGTLLVIVRATEEGSQELLVLDTSDHQPIAGLKPLELVAPATDLVLSAKGRYAIVAHASDGAGGRGGVTIIDIRALSQGESASVAVRFQDLGAVGRVTVAAERPDRVYALINRLDGLSCGDDFESKIVELRLDNAQIPPIEKLLGTLVQDIAVSDIGDVMVAADTCKDALWHMPWPLPLGQGPQNVLNGRVSTAVRNVSTVAIWNDTIWTIDSRELVEGGLIGSEAELTLLSFNLAGELQTQVKLPPLVLNVEARGFSDVGQEATLKVAADGLHAYDLAIAPGAGSIAVLVEGSYRTSPNLDPSSGDLILPGLSIDTVEYLLIDLATLGPVQHEVSRCDLRVLDTGALISDLRCPDASDVKLNSALDQAPQGLSILYGTR